MEEEENNGEEKALEVFLRTRPHPTVEHGAAYRRVGSVERIHGRLRNPSKKRKQKGEDTDLDIQLPEVVEEHLDPVVVLCLVQEDKLHVCCS